VILLVTMLCQSHHHCASIAYHSTIHFRDDLVELMLDDPKSLIHGAHNGSGLGERGRKYFNKYEDRGAKLADGRYDQEAIKYNIEHAAEMIAQYLTYANSRLDLLRIWMTKATPI